MRGEYCWILLQEGYVWISETKLDGFYHSGFSDYCLQLYCYIHHVSADMSPDFLQVFVELESLSGTSNHDLYLIHGVACSDFVNHESEYELW